MATDEAVYTFSVNTRNTKLDARGRNRRYDAQFESAVAKAATTWYCEMRIPRDAFPGDVKRINFTHTDGKTGAKSLWVPTLGHYLSVERYGFAQGLSSR